MQTSDVINILCVVLGFVLATFTDEIKHQWRQRTQAKTIRSLIVDEMHYNKTILRGILKKVKEQDRRHKETTKPDGAGGVFESEESGSDVLRKFAPSSLSNELWSSQLQNLSAAFTGKEALDCIRFYRKLEEIEVQYAIFVAPSHSHIFSHSMQPLLNVMESTLAVPLPQR